MNLQTERSQTPPESNALPNILRTKSPDILALWEVWVRKEVEASVELKSSDLRNSLPKVLENLANALEYVEGRSSIDIKVASEHGRERSALPQYSLGQIITEYRLLRRAIFTVLKETKISSDDRDLIIDAIEIGISEAVSEFSNKQYQLREQFISTLAHDLRNPLSAAKTGAQLILRNPENSDQVQLMASRIVDTISRTDRMIKDLLDSNSVRMGQTLPLVIQQANLRSLAKVTIEEVASVHGDRFKLEAESDTLGFWDVSILQRAIGNLLVNAIKYGAQDQPVIIKLTEDAKNVSVTVHNEGNPIPESEQIHIFDNFYRVSDLKTNRDKGWGIGLYLVKGAVIAHRGQIKVESSQEKGTNFIMIFPRDCRPKDSSLTH